MPHHHVQVWIHLVWHVHAGSPRVSPDVQAWVWPAIAAKAREVGCSDVVVGGAANHVHVLAALPAAVAVARLAQRLKGASSRALRVQGFEDFAWQEGYGAFSVSRDDVRTVMQYVQNQAQHHGEGTAGAQFEWQHSDAAQPGGHLEP